MDLKADQQENQTKNTRMEVQTRKDNHIMNGFSVKLMSANTNLNSEKVQDVKNHENQNGSLSHDLIVNDMAKMVINGIETSANNHIIKVQSENLREIPQSLLSCSCVRELYLDYNEIYKIPDLCDLKYLEILSLVGNQLETLPESFGDCSTLKELYLNENLLTGLPSSFGKLWSLKVLNVVGNNIHELVDNFGDLISLEKVFADENTISALPQSFGRLANLTVAEFAFNQISSIPETFGDLNELEILDLNKNNIVKLPESFGKLPKLKFVDLSKNNISKLPSQFRSASCLVKFHADTNALKTLPDWIGNMPNLEEFSVKDNQIHSAPLCESFGHNSGKLRVLEMGGNFIEALPYSIGELQNLEVFHMGSVISELERKAYQNGNLQAVSQYLQENIPTFYHNILNFCR